MNAGKISTVHHNIREGSTEKQPLNSFIPGKEPKWLNEVKFSIVIVSC